MVKMGIKLCLSRQRWQPNIGVIVVGMAQNNEVGAFQVAGMLMNAADS
jgi:hypothetical protein